MTKKNNPEKTTIAKYESNIPIDDGLQFYVTKDGLSFESVMGETDPAPIGWENLKKVIKELNDNDSSIEDDDISIFVLTKLKVKTHRIIEIIKE